MRLLPSDPDIKTIVSRIVDKDINLQPNFQRGEVWGTQKKIRLIDTILREWHVPPIHVIEVKETGRQEVLDGQQRLVAIRDFVIGRMTVDGNIEPLNEEIQKLNGLEYSQLPDLWRRRFDRFTIRIYNITDYLPSEPGELFYRLNQPTNLTSAEQRNAFFGPARSQVKDLVEKTEIYGLTRKEVGFSNSRMAYDDVFARLCVYLEIGALLEKITATSLADQYRSTVGFSARTIERAEYSIKLFSDSTRYFKYNAKFNKATLLSWLCFVSQMCKMFPHITSQDIGHFISNFEELRNTENYRIDYFRISSQIITQLIDTFNDRASSRVADVSSVLIRDFIIWLLYRIYLDDNKIQHKFISNNSQFSKIEHALDQIKHDDRIRTNSEFQEILINVIQQCEWGTHI